jgi:hypothetical protein
MSGDLPQPPISFFYRTCARLITRQIHHRISDVSLFSRLLPKGDSPVPNPADLVCRGGPIRVLGPCISATVTEDRPMPRKEAPPTKLHLALDQIVLEKVNQKAGKPYTRTQLISSLKGGEGRFRWHPNSLAASISRLVEREAITCFIHGEEVYLRPTVPEDMLRKANETAKECPEQCRTGA